MFREETFLRKQAITSLLFNISRQKIWDDAFEAYYSDEIHSLPVHVAEKISTSIFHQEGQLLNKKINLFVDTGRTIFHFFFHVSIYMWKNTIMISISFSIVNALEYVKFARK